MTRNHRHSPRITTITHRAVSTFLLVLALHITTATAADILSLLPKSNEVAGWAATEKPRKYVSQQLWEYIDGGADVYLDFGFRQVATVDLESKGRRITVDVFEMGSVDDAFGIYASERSPSENFLTIGVEGYLSGSSLIFYQDRYYVKVNGSSTDGTVRNAVQQVAKGVSARIGGTRKPPAVLGMFPTKGRMKHSETRAHASFLGQKTMKGTFATEYSMQGRKMTAFILVTPSATNAAARVKQFKTVLSAAGSIDDAVKTIGADAFATGRHSTARELVIACKGRYVFGLYPATSARAAEDVLTAMASSMGKK